jgi:hypothetical protein
MSEARQVPLLGDLPLTIVQRIDHSLDAGFVSYPIAGLAGEWQQRAGRASHRIEIEGLLIGDEAPAQLAALQAAAAAGEAVPFAADITSALALQRVVITSLHAVEEAGAPRRFAYRLALVESPPLPPPAQVEAFGGLDDFGLGDLGFDADLGSAIGDLAREAGQAVDQALDLAGKLGVLEGLDGAALDGFLAPLEDASGAIGDAGGALRDAMRALAGELRS